MSDYKVVISLKAQSDLTQCISFVLKVSKEAAIELRDDIFSALESLNPFPEKNPIFEMPKNSPITIRKQIVNKRYIILYSIEKDKIVVYRILDARRGFDQVL